MVPRAIEGGPVQLQPISPAAMSSSEWVMSSARSRCRGCGELIVWGTHRRTGNHSPFDLGGEPHWATCVAAARFRRARHITSDNHK